MCRYAHIVHVGGVQKAASRAAPQELPTLFSMQDVLLGHGLIDWSPRIIPVFQHWDYKCGHFLIMDFKGHAH